MKKSLFLLCLCLGLLYSCDDKKDTPEPAVADFDRAAYLSDLAGIIEQAYAGYENRLQNMSSAAEQFESEKSMNALLSLRTAWHEALIAWQHVAPFEFGLAEDLGISNSNIYPVDVSRIQNSIEAENYQFDSAVNLSTAGLQALDYMLHGLGDTDMTILSAYQSGDVADKHHRYVAELIQHLREKIAAPMAQWELGSQARNAFIANDGTNQGSSLGLFLNAFNKGYEKGTRTLKLGIPTGALTFSQTPNPNTVEGYYEKSNSIVYLLESIEVYEELYLGPEGGLGLEEYLNTLNAQHGNRSLDEVIKEQLEQVKLAVEGMDAPLSEYVVNEHQNALDVYAELQNLVVLWKVDMMSTLGILISYQDNDGD